MRKPLTLIPAALLLASCATGPADESTPQETPEVVGPPTMEAPEPISLTEPQTFEFTTPEGTAGTLTIPADPYAPMEEFYTAVEPSGDRTYAAIDIDNRQGTTGYSVNEVNLYTPEGEQFTLDTLNAVIVDYSPFSPSEPAFDLSDAATEAVDGDTAVGERRTEYVVTEQPLPTEVTRIEVVQSGGSSVQVYPEAPEGGIQ